MRVIQLGPYPPPHGGVQHNLVAIHRLLLQRGHSSRVINITRFRKPDEKNVYYPKTWAHLLILLLRLKYDIVHLHIGGNVTGRLLALSLVCSMIPRRKAVLTFHSGGYPESRQGKSASPRSLRGFIFRRFDRIIAVNPRIQEMFVRFGLHPERVRLIYPFAIADTVRERSLPENLSVFFESHHPVLMTVGLLESEYDLSRQIETLGFLRENHPGAGLVIVGSGSLEETLRSEISAKPYARHILLCGDTPHDDTLNAIRACTVFLRTTFYDGDSIAVREALHLGVPVIATDTGTRPPGVHLISSPAPSALVRMINEILEQPAASRQVRDVPNENIDSVLQLYGELMRES